MKDKSDSETIANKDEARKRGAKLFPVMSFEDSLVLAKGIVEHSAGKQMRRLTLFDKIQKSPTSGPSRLLVTTSNRYGLTTGSYTAEYIAITEDASTILSETSSQKERYQKRFQLAIQQQDIFQKLYERLKDKRVPAIDVIRDELEQLGVPVNDRNLAATLFLQNVRDLGLIREMSGKETLVTVDLALEELPDEKPKNTSILKEKQETQKEDTHEPKQEEKLVHSFNLEPNITVNIGINIAADTKPDTIKLIFENMKTYLLTKDND